MIPSTPTPRYIQVLIIVASLSWLIQFSLFAQSDFVVRWYIATKFYLFRFLVEYLGMPGFADEDDSTTEDWIGDSSPDWPSYSAPYSHVCLGGTFDRIHNGHKVLLSVGALLARELVLVGITRPCLLRNKKLAPLILPWEKRCSDVRNFLKTIGLAESNLEIVGLDDVYGPPAIRPEFQCIVASSESIPNCLTLNELRTSKSMNPLEFVTIDFVPKCESKNNVSQPSDLQECKLSSSNFRFNLLGQLLRPVNEPVGLSNQAHSPYIIGLFGPSGCGKSALAQRLAKLGQGRVHIVDCDRLGHEAYKPGTSCYQKILSHFGADRVACPTPPHPIDRKLLGALVFSNPQYLKELNEIVWPEIDSQIVAYLQDLEIQLKDAAIRDRPIVVLDAAVLLQAGWDQRCHELWLGIIPRNEAERRLCERNNLKPEAASERLERQASGISEVSGGLDWWFPGQIGSGRGPVDKAHVILSTEWEPECSQRQVEKAWTALLGRITSLVS